MFPTVELLRWHTAQTCPPRLDLTPQLLGEWALSLNSHSSGLALAEEGPRLKPCNRMTDNPGVKAQCPDLRSEAFPAPELLLGLD